jgi:hypothetical protein
MEAAFPFVVFGSVGLFLVVGLLSMLTRNSVYDQIGQGGLSMDEHHGLDEWGAGGAAPDSPAAQAEREQEIRQMLQARSERGVRQGREPLDIDAELARLTGPAAIGGPWGGTGADAGLNAEVRQLVMARNERRVRRGQEPLDVDAEVQRTLRELST